MTIWRTYYHLVWATHDRQPLITDRWEAELYEYIRTKANSLDAPLHAIGGVTDHIHLIVSIPPKHAIAQFVAQIKGGSSHQINRIATNQNNHQKNHQKFAWQKEYGVFSLGRKQLDLAVTYVENQKQHHATPTTLIHSLEPEIFNPS